MSGSGVYSHEIRVGDAAELIVEADLLLQGLVPIRAWHKYPYDFLVPRGTDFVKVQVKAVSEPRMEGPAPGEYQFSLRQGKARDPYKPGEIDVFALVALDLWLIAYKTEDSLLKPQGVITTLNLWAAEFLPLAEWPYK